MKIKTDGFGFLGIGSGSIELTDIDVRIQKKNSSFSMPYHSITSVHLSEGGNWTSRAFIQIIGAGDVTMTDGEVATAHPSCLAFKGEFLSNIKKLKTEIEKRIQASRQPSSGGPSIADEIKKFAELLAAGLLTQTEFDEKKKQLLGL
jgi:hypothetical protein